MKVMDADGGETLALTLRIEEEEVTAHASFSGGAAELDLPRMTLSFESVKEGLLVHMGLAGTDRRCDVLVEYADVKVLKEIPGKGLVSFALKAFR